MCSSRLLALAVPVGFEGREALRAKFLEQMERVVYDIASGGDSTAEVNRTALDSKL